tara:strand:- start:924 stop:1850 length:927 start_codon:yes stop_codon:yes gene_type:complete
MVRFDLFVIFLLVFLVNFNVQADIKIKFKVGEDIITNIDILKEKNYLIFFRPDLSKLNEKDIIKISENSLIRELIKKKELDKIFKDTNNQEFIGNLKKNLFLRYNVQDEKQFKSLLTRNNIRFEDLLTKVKYEGLWNELIYMKYNNSVKIDKEKTRKELILKISNKKKYEYNLSEILFDIDKNEKLISKHAKIINTIREKNFKTAASKYSISSSSDVGGKLGWIKETMLSNNLNKMLGNMKKNQITKPIKYPNGYLLLKINDKKEMKQIVDIEKELNDLISYEKDKQLNQFSLLYYKKLKQNTEISEY